MNLGGTILREVAGLSLGLILALPLVAQQSLYVVGSDGNYHRVLKVSRDRPFYKEQGKLVPASGTRYALRKIEEYQPVYIQVLAKQAGTTNQVLLTRGPLATAPLNNEFHFTAKFESAVRLDDVYLVLELETTKAGRNLVAYEIGLLEAGKPKDVSVDLPLGETLGPGKYKLLLFNGGAEVFSSEQDAAYREEMLDHMVAKRIAGVQQASPRPFFGPGPVYPTALRESGLRGVVMMELHISSRGMVLDPVVVSTTHPAFGEAALAVLSQWRFVPQVENGRAVEARVKMPLAFDPPMSAGAETP